jgi:uncharacterized repeat protein (TIGR03803 family)
MKPFVLFLLLLFSTFASAGEKVPYSFQGGTRGFYPAGPLVLDEAGNFYGTTTSGGKDGFGTVFELSPDGHGGWTETILHSFTGGSDGQDPMAGLILDGQGDLFGTTLGPNPCTPYCGSVFELSPRGKGWKFILLHAFRGENDGGIVDGGVTIDAAGNLYGTTHGFGANGHGTVFKLSSSASGWKLTTLHAFGFDADGADPAGTLVLTSHGTIYGVAQWGGGGSDAGVLYSLSLNAKGKWIEKVLYSFQGGKDGAQVTGLISDQHGSLYGVSDIPAGFGSAFRFAENHDGTWIKKTIYGFRSESSGNASSPQGNVVLDKAGNAYGLAAGGENHDGSLYELALQSDGKFIETQLYSFQGGDDGRGPMGPLVMDSSGNLYGVTQVGGGEGCGGNNGCGTVFEYAP